MSIGYEISFGSPVPDNWRAMTGDWPDAPWRGSSQSAHPVARSFTSRRRLLDRALTL